MTTTSTFSGMKEEAKPSSRVLRPPGGGSSNIFGTADPAPAPAQNARPSAKPADSGVFNNPPAASSDRRTEKGGAQRTARDGDDSFSRLFGDSASPSAGSLKGSGANQQVDTHANLFGDSAHARASPLSQPQGQSSHDKLFGEVADGNSGSQGDRAAGSYNPITGSDYNDLAPNHHALNVKETPKAQKEQPPLPCSDGEFQAREGKMQNVQTSTRVTNPPGGKTHKLW